MKRSWLALLAAMTAGPVLEAQEDEPEPDLSFLEYLGSWQEGDDEWLIVAEIEEDTGQKDGTSANDAKADETDDTDED